MSADQNCVILMEDKSLIGVLSSFMVVSGWPMVDSCLRDGDYHAGEV